MRHTGVGLHFILAQHRRAAKCRLAQTLAITVSAQCNLSRHRNARLREIALASGREFLEQPSRVGFAIFHEGARIIEVRCWLALRASVLRRAVSSAGTAQERRAKLSAVAVFWDFRCTEPSRWSSASRRRCHAVPQPASFPHKHTPQERQLRNLSMARLMASTCLPF